MEPAHPQTLPGGSRVDGNSLSAFAPILIKLVSGGQTFIHLLDPLCTSSVSRGLLEPHMRWRQRTHPGQVSNL